MGLCFLSLMTLLFPVVKYSSAIPSYYASGQSYIGAPIVYSQGVPNVPSFYSQAIPNAPSFYSQGVPNAPSYYSQGVPDAPSYYSQGVPNGPSVSYENPVSYSSPSDSSFSEIPTSDSLSSDSSPSENPISDSSLSKNPISDSPSSDSSLSESPISDSLSSDSSPSENPISEISSSKNEPSDSSSSDSSLSKNPFSDSSSSDSSLSESPISDSSSSESSPSENGPSENSHTESASDLKSEVGPAVSEGTNQGSNLAPEQESAKLPATQQEAGAQGSLDCNFYQDYEEKMKCGPGGYLSAYGYKYCNSFSTNFEKFDPAGQEWVKRVKQCLINYLKPHFDDYPNDAFKSDCDALKEGAFESHVNCYYDSGFCDIWSHNVRALWDTYDGIEAFKTLIAVKQAGNVGTKCIADYISEVKEKFDEKGAKYMKGLGDSFQRAALN